MKISVILAVCTFALLLVSCGTKKQADTLPVGHSQQDYAYIEKFHEGVRLKAKGQNKEAIAVFLECLSMRENDDAVHFALSQLYLLDGNLALSGEEIQKAAKLDPENIHYISELAYFHVENQKYDLAAEQFAKLVKADPRNPEYSYPYAECLARSGQYEAAIVALDKTEDQLGIYPEITIQKFQLYQQINQPEKGLDEIEKARLQYPEDAQLLSALVDYYLSTKQEDKAVETLETLAKNDDANGRVHLFLADFYRRRGETNKFYASAKKAMAADGIEIDAKTQFLSSLQEGGGKMDAQSMELAEIFAITHPSDAKPFSVLGDFHLSNGNDAEALVNYRKALQFEKGASSLWNQVLLMEYQAAKFDELAIDSKEGLKYFPTLPTFYLLNGVANIQLKQYDEAISNLEIGQEYITNDKAIKAEFCGQLGEAYFGKKDYKKGIALYEKALAMDPSSSLLLNNYAYRLAISKIELAKAEKLIKTALERSPEQANFIDTYGFVLFQKGNFEEAKIQFEKSFKLDGKDKVTAEHLGDVYVKLNNTQEAQKFWATAKELGAQSDVLDKKIANSKYYEAE